MCRVELVHDWGRTERPAHNSPTGMGMRARQAGVRLWCTCCSRIFCWIFFCVASNPCHLSTSRAHARLSYQCRFACAIASDGGRAPARYSVTGGDPRRRRRLRPTTVVPGHLPRLLRAKTDSESRCRQCMPCSAQPAIQPRWPELTRTFVPLSTGPDSGGLPVTRSPTPSQSQSRRRQAAQRAGTGKAGTRRRRVRVTAAAAAAA